MLYQNITIVAAFLLFYSLFAGRFEKRLINGPLMFLLAGFLLGSEMLAILAPRIDGQGMRVLAEITLAIVLFTDAANANLSVLRANRAIPLRLLLIGLPLTLLGGWGFGVLVFPQMPWLEIAILSTILAPTDAALGKAVVSNQHVAAPTREGLNVESGLNDGICVPVLFILLALLEPLDANKSTAVFALELFIEEIGVGAVIGVVLALLTTTLITFTDKRGWQMPMWRQLTMPGLALLSFATAQWLGGSGFIAAFVCGLVIGKKLLKDKHEYLFSNEGYGELLSVIVWLFFGAVIITMAEPYLSWQTWLYAIVSLTLLRIVPVWLSLLGSGLALEEKLFIGWFGPRGLASIVFVVIALQSPMLAKSTIGATVICTILLSVILHGVTANPWVARMAREKS
jgi:NhaP-type Na+/H+ or K+/H+ antiporter